MLSRFLASSWIVVAAAVVLTLGAGPVTAAPPAAPAVSSFAPADDLVPQIDEYVKGFEEAVADAAAYADAESGLKKDANVFILMAVALGVHDEDNKYKPAAPALVEASKKLAAAADFAAAKAAVADIKKALAAKGDAAKLTWTEKEASMKELMEAVPLIHARLKRYMRRFDRGATENAQYSAAIAVVGQGSMPNAVDTIKPTEVEAWYKYCAEMRDAAAAVNKAVHGKDEAAATKAMDALQKSCDDCHAVFHPTAPKAE